MSTLSGGSVPSNGSINQPPPAAAAAPTAKKSNFIGAVSNLSIQYALSSMSIAVAFMTSDEGRVVPDADKNVHHYHADYPEPSWAKYMLLGMVFAGTIAGMCLMGYLGDLIGRKRAMVVTLGITSVSALASAVVPWGSASTIYALLATFRFTLGVGVGGIYPLSAVQSAEDSSGDEHSSTRVGWAFFWQTPGAMAPYAVALLLTLLPHRSWVTSLQFRLLLGIGAIPAFIVMFAEMRKKENAIFEAKRSQNPLTEAWRHKEHFRTLLAGTWLVYDVTYYGTAIFTPEILKDIFGNGDSLVDVSWQSLVVNSIGLPGAVAAILLLKPKGGRWLNIYGFLLIAVSFAALGTVYAVDRDGLHTLKFVLFCIISFALNFGPNVATYVLPTSSFPTNVRSTFHGLSAGMGKVGAVIGTFMYQPIADRFGIAAVLWVQVVLALVGVLVSVFFIRKDSEYLEEPIDDESDPLVAAEYTARGRGDNHY